MSTDLEPLQGLDQEGNVGKDLFAGATGGIAQVLIGQPFGKWHIPHRTIPQILTCLDPQDIVKVRLQTTSQYTGALDAATQIWKNEGPAAFYKGTLTPLIGIGACVSIQFGAFHFARRFFESRAPPTLTSSAPTLTYTQYYLSGAFAGLTNSALSGPIEHIRIRLQTQPTPPATRLYSGPLSCIRALRAHNALYRGQAVTLLREAQAYGVWFLTYELLMNWDVARRGLASRRDVEPWRLAAYGGLAGEALWLASYPFDVVKSKMQTDGLRVPGKAAPESVPAGVLAGRDYGEVRYRNMRACFAHTYAHEGLAGFWRGIGPTLLRAMPVSAATFAVAEMTLRLIS